jgi:HD-like signal output (HDOD) protein
MSAVELDPPTFAEQILEDVATNRIQLPTLPEVALRVREAVESEESDAASVAEIVTQDPALTTRLLQVANSALYGSARRIDNIQMVVTRLGLKLVKNLVISLAMKQMFQATSDALDHAFRRIWNDSVEVAAIARVLATGVRGLEPEQAMLAGLIHNIGALPVFARLELELGFEADRALVEHLLNAVAPALGRDMLREWQFADCLVEVPVACRDLKREREEADYADLVLVARLEHLASSGQADADSCPTEWPNYSAFARIGVDPEITVLELEGPAEQIAEVRSLIAG